MKSIPTLTRLLALVVFLGLPIGMLVPAQGYQGTTLTIIPKKRTPSGNISFSFQQAPIDEILRFIADASGKTVFKDPSVTGDFTVRNQSQLSVPDALKLLTTILALRGYAMLVTDDAVIVTTTADARTRRELKVTYGKKPEDVPTGKEIITHIFPLEAVDALRLRDELQPLFPAGNGILIANSDTNSLIVVDEADNIRKLALIIQQVDKPQTDALAIDLIQLKFADATEVARYLTDLFRQDQPQAGAGAGGFPPAGIPFPGLPGAQPGGRPMGGGASNLALLRGRVRFAADVRANALVVSASPANMKEIRDLIQRIDQPNPAPRTEYRIVQLKFADANGIADQLNQLLDPNARPGGARAGGFGGFGGFGGGGFGGGNRGTTGGNPALDGARAVPDTRTNSLVLTAPAEGIDSIVQLIRMLDVESQVTSVVRVFQLQNAIASEVATTLRQLFQGQAGGGGLGFGLFGGGGRTQIPPNSPLDLLRQVTIVPNDQTNQLLIAGPNQTFPVIEQLLSEDKGLDRRLPQVFIEVIIADITLDDSSKFGIEWQAMAGSSSFAQSFGLNTPTADPTGFRYSVLSRNIQALFQTLKTTDRIKIVSTPHVMVTDNSPALIEIGESIPYAGQSTVTNGVVQSSVEFLPVSITLNVTPHISPGDQVLLDIDQVVNSLISFITVAPGQQAPRTTNRRAGTTVVVGDNQTVVLGGIISTDNKRQTQKIPILGDIPILGNLFRNQTRSNTRTELVVFLTPRIVRDPKDANDIRDYERSRLQVDPLDRLNAPFANPPDINPEALRSLRRGAFEKSQDPLKVRSGPAPRGQELLGPRGLMPGPGGPPDGVPPPGGEMPGMGAPPGGPGFRGGPGGTGRPPGGRRPPGRSPGT